MSFASAYRLTYTLSVIAAVIGVGCGIVPYYTVSKMIIALIAGNTNPGFYVNYCLITAGFWIAKTLFHNISTGISHKATFSVISDIRYRISSKLEKSPMGYILDTPSGKFKNIIVEKVDSIEPTLAHVLPEMTSNLLIPLGIIGYLFALDWRMALISLITLPVGFLCYMGMMKDYEVKFKEYLAVQKHVNAVSVEFINGIEVIKAFNQSASSYKKFTDAVKANAHTALDWMKSVQLYFAMALGIWPAVLIGVLPAGCIFIMNGTLTAGNFITIMLLALGIIGPLLSAMYYTDDLAKIGSTFKEISTILDSEEMSRPENEAELKGTDIRFKNVGFSYADKKVLHDINLDIRAGTVNALVGPSGGGKSTIAKLLAGLWDTDSGSISIGGTDIKELPFRQAMNLIAYVSQDNYLFDTSIRENIRMADRNATNEDVENAARASGCHEFIMSLQNGYDTIAGGAGGHLSGGERQRITIARAMLKNSPIIILDEATAYTDPENEAVIQRAVAKLVKGKTLIVIAHRLSTITDSDNIILIEDGRVADSGTHNELLRASTVYKSMWEAHIGTRESEFEGAV